MPTPLGYLGVYAVAAASIALFILGARWTADRPPGEGRWHESARYFPGGPALVVGAVALALIVLGAVGALRPVPSRRALVAMAAFAAIIVLSLGYAWRSRPGK